MSKALGLVRDVWGVILIFMVYIFLFTCFSDNCKTNAEKIQKIIDAEYNQIKEKPEKSKPL